MAGEAELLEAFEGHSPEGIRRALQGGASPVRAINGKRPIDCLIEGYLRSPRLAECVRVMTAAGAEVGNPVLEAILLDDAAALARLPPGAREERLSLLTAFTSCRNVTPLHVCAEFNAVNCGRVLLEMGADVNAPALVDAEGIGGQTPVFHAVNSIFNYCRPVMEMLVEAGASLDVRVPLLAWGETFPWETLVFDATPIAYAQCGLYRQFHRAERDVYDNLAFLYRTRHGGRVAPPPERNVPNEYLARG